MDICEEINYITGKIVAYLLLIVYPFVMHNIFNLDNKIFGAREAATAWVLSDYSDIASNILNRSRVDNAHNIWLNTLVTLGIAGLAVYVLIIGLSIHDMIKFPMFFCLIAMLNSGIRRYEKVK